MNSDYGYVTHDDLCSLFPNNTLLGIKAPMASSLNVVIPPSPDQNDENSSGTTPAAADGTAGATPDKE